MILSWQEPLTIENLDAVFDQETYQNITSEYKKFKELASTIGCSRENPSFFFIQHVYPHILSRVPIAAKRMEENAIRPNI